MITMKPQVTKTISGTIILLEGIYESICKACILQTMSCNSTSHEECMEDGYRLDSNTISLDCFISEMQSILLILIKISEHFDVRKDQI